VKKQLQIFSKESLFGGRSQTIERKAGLAKMMLERRKHCLAGPAIFTMPCYASMVYVAILSVCIPLVLCQNG